MSDGPPSFTGPFTSNPAAAPDAPSTAGLHEQWFQRIVEVANEGIWLIDRDARTLFVNQRMADMLGYSIAELMGRSMPEFCFDDDIPLARERIGANLHGAAEQFDFRFRRKDGGELLVQACTSAMLDESGAVTGALGMFSDVSERKRAEEASAYLAAIVASSSDAIISKTLDGIITSWNAGAEHILGYRAEEIIGQSILRLIPPERRTEEEHILAQLKAGVRVDHFETVRVTRDGRRLDVSLTISPVRDGTGKIIGASKILRDISERKRIEEKLRVSEDRLRLAVAAGAIGIWDIDLRSGERSWSRQGKAIYGLAPDEPLDYERQLALVHPDDRARVHERVTAFRDDGASSHLELEHRIVRPDGCMRWVAVHGEAIYDGGAQPVRLVGTIIDISERKEREHELEARVRERTLELQAANADLRELAGHLQTSREEERANIARELHDDLAQILTVIKMDLTQLTKTFKGAPTLSASQQSEAAEKLRNITQSVDEGVRAIRTLLANLRPQLLDDLGLRAALEWQLEQFQQRTGIEAQFTTDVDALSWDSERETALFRILQESLTNVARHSGATRVEVSLRRDADALTLEVRDNGRGISHDEMAKANHFGILGMRERALLLGGDVQIEGMPGGGTTIVVRVPH